MSLWLHFLLAVGSGGIAIFLWLRVIDFFQDYREARFETRLALRAIRQRLEVAHVRRVIRTQAAMAKADLARELHRIDIKRTRPQPHIDWDAIFAAWRSETD